MSPSELSISEESDTDTDMHTVPSDGTDAEDVNNNTVFAPTTINRMSIHENCGRSAKESLPFVNPNTRQRSSSSMITPKQSQFFQSFHFATGLVTFSWLLYFFWKYMYPNDFDLNPESLIYKFSQLPLHTSLLLSCIISIVSTATITAVSMGILKLYENQPPEELYRLKDYPKHYTSSDPAQRELDHAQILEEYNHGSMRPQTPYNYTSDTKPIVDARGVYKNTESGMNFIDGYYLQRIRKFKKTLEDQQEILERIRTKHQTKGYDEKSIPQYMLCSPCYDSYNCNRVHFDYNGHRYHCQPYEEDFGETRQKMSKVKIYKDNVLGKPFKKEEKSKDMSAPNDFPGRDLHSLISKKFPPFADDFDMSKKLESTKHEAKLAPPNPFRKLCPRKDPCIYCRSINPPQIHENCQPPSPPKEAVTNDYNGNQLNQSRTAPSPSNHDGSVDNKDAAPAPDKKAVAVGPNVLYVNYNFDYQ